MQLKITRSQRTAGVMSKSVIFCVDARAELSPEQKADVQKYKMGSKVIYNSEASKKHLEKAEATGGLRGLASLALAAMKLNITIDGLMNGTHIECKDLDEVLGAEDALHDACRRLKRYLDMAALFDGHTDVYDFSKDKPEPASATTSTAGTTPLSSEDLAYA